MLKFFGTLAFLIFLFCAIMLIISVFNRRMNVKIWGISILAALVVLITCYYIDIAVNTDNQQTLQTAEQYYD